MFGDLLKLFTEEPGKRNKIIIGTIKIILTVTFAGFLHKKIIGPLQETIPSTFNAWIDYFTNGHLLMYLFILAISYTFLFTIFARIFTMLIWFLTKRKKNISIDSSTEKHLLKTFDIVIFDKTKDSVKPGRNINALYSLSRSLSNPKKSAFAQQHYNNIFESIGQLYAAFMLVYFTSLISINSFSKIWWLVLIVGILILWSYKKIKGLLDYMIYNHEEIITKLDVVSMASIIENVFEEYGIEIPERNSPKLPEGVFKHNSKKIRFYTKLLIKPTLKEYNRMKEFTSEKNEYFFIVLVRDSFNAIPVEKFNNANYVILKYTNNKQFREGLISIFDKKSLEQER